MAFIQDFKYLKQFHFWGIKLSLISNNNGNGNDNGGGNDVEKFCIIPSPQDILTDDLRAVLRNHKAELIGEIQNWENLQRTILWVSTTLEHFEDTDPRHGFECGGQPIFKNFSDFRPDNHPVYRTLDARYFVWIRAHVEKAKAQYDAGALSDETYEYVKSQFSKILAWAINNIGEEQLQMAMRTVNLKIYSPPSQMTLDEYLDKWREAQKRNCKMNKTESEG